MQFRTFKNVCRVADYLVAMEEDSLTPAILWAMGIPRSRNFISEMKRDLEQAGIIRRETRGYTPGKEYQRFSLVTQLYRDRKDYERPFEARIAEHFDVCADVKAYLYLLDKRESTMTEMVQALDIPKATLSRALKALVSDGLATRDPGEGRSYLFRSTGTFLNRVDYLDIYLHADEKFYSSYCSTDEEHMEESGNGVSEVGERTRLDGDVMEGFGVENIYEEGRACCRRESDHAPELPPILVLKSRFKNLTGKQRVIVRPPRDEVENLLSGFDRRISVDVVSRVKSLNHYYDEHLIPDLFHLRFRWNYKFSQTEKSTSITKSTRMTHAEWCLPKYRKQYPKNHGEKFYSPYIRTFLGSDYKSFDIKAAVPRVNAAMNGVFHSREEDLYLSLVAQAAKSHPSWKPILDEFIHHRPAIKRLFMLFFFTGNLLQTGMSTCANEFQRQDRKRAIIEKVLSAAEAAIKVAEEVITFDPLLRQLLQDAKTAAAFSTAINTALGQVYNREVFLVESLIELDVLWHFISQGRCIINNYDEFFFLDDISEEEVSQVIEERIRVRGAEFYDARHPAKKVRKGKGGKVTVEAEELRKAS